MIVAKANRMLGFLKRNCAGIVGSTVLLRLYCSLVRSHFCFCSQLRAPQSSTSNLILVENIQRRATRFILRNSNLCYKARLIKLKLLPLSYWLEYLDLVFFFKCLHGLIDFTREFSYYSSFLKGDTCFIRVAFKVKCLSYVFLSRLLLQQNNFDVEQFT